MKLSSIQKLYDFLSPIGDKEMPITTAYKFAKLMGEIEDSNDFYMKKIRSIIAKYSEKDENGNPVQDEKGNISVQKEFIDNATKEIDELNNIEVDKPDVTFTLEELKTLNMKPREAAALIDFIVEENK